MLTPTRKIAGPKTGFVWPMGVFVDGVNKELYVADFFGQSVRVFPLNAKGDAAPIRVLKDGPASGLGQVRAVIIPDDNELIVVSFNDSIRVYPRTANGDVAPTRVIQGVKTKLNNPLSVAYLAGDDELFVDSYGAGGSQNSGILVFNRADSGNISPKRVISGSKTQLGAYCNYVAVDAVNKEIFAQGNSGKGVVVFKMPTATWRRSGI